MTHLVRRSDDSLDFRVYSDIEAIAASWNQLALRQRAAPFLAPGWYEIWNRVFGERDELKIFTLSRGGELAAIAPLRVHRGKFRSPTNWHTPGFDVLSEDETVASELLNAILEQEPYLLDLRFVSERGRAYAAMPGTAATRGLDLRRALLRSPIVRTEGDWDQYERGLSQNLRKDINRRLRRLNESGDVELEVTSGGDRLEELLAEGFAVEASGWKGRDGTAIASHSNTLGFYSDLARWADSRDELRLAFLRLDGRAIAFIFGLEAHGVHYALKAGYLEDASRFAPSKVQHHLLIERAFRTDLSSYSFLGASDPYKVRWANDWDELFALQIFSRRPRGLAHWAFERYCKPVARRARNSISRRTRH